MISLSRVAIAVITVALLAGCGEPSGTPSAQDILAKPTHANLRDAHFILSGKFINNGATIDLGGDGQVVYKSAPAAGRSTLQSTVAGHPVTFEDIFINGIDYGLTQPGNGKWTAKTTTTGLGPSSFSGASNFKYLGEEQLPLGRAWHAQARDRVGNAFEGWIRESDGFPLKYLLLATNTRASTTLTLTFDKYNTGVTITAPPASEIAQG